MKTDCTTEDLDCPAGYACRDYGNNNVQCILTTSTSVSTTSTAGTTTTSGTTTTTAPSGCITSAKLYVDPVSPTAGQQVTFMATGPGEVTVCEDFRLINATGCTDTGWRNSPNSKDTNPWYRKKTCTAAADGHYNFGVYWRERISGINCGTGTACSKVRPNMYMTSSAPRQGNTVKVTVTSGGECASGISTNFGASLSNCRGGCNDGGIWDGCACNDPARPNPTGDGRPCWWRWTCTAGTAGNYKAWFNALTQGCYSSRYYTVTAVTIPDTTPPQTTLTAYSPDPTNDNTPTYSGTATDTQSNVNAAEYRYKLSSSMTWSAWANVALFTPARSVLFTFTLPALADGTYNIEARSRDAAGNWDPTPAPDMLTIDTRAPTGTVTINNGAAYTNSAAVTLTLTCSDASGCSEMKISNDGSSWSTFAYSATKAWTLTQGDGTKTVYAKFKDRAGNWMATPVTDTIVLDTTPPTVAINSPPTPAAGSWQRQNFPVGYSVTDNIAPTQCNLFTTEDGISFINIGPIQCGTGLQVGITVGASAGNSCRTQGSNRCGAVIWARDAAGNTGTGWRAFSIDWTAPTLSVTHLPASPITTDTVTVTATAPDAMSGLRNVKVYVDKNRDGDYSDAGEQTTCTTPSCSSPPSRYATGTYTYYATAEDNAGNTARDPATGVKTFTVTAGPTTSTTLPTTSTTTIRPTTSTTSTTTSTSTTSTTTTTIGDTTPPTSSITSPPAGSWQKQSFPVSITDSDTGGSGLRNCYYKVFTHDGTNWIETKATTTRICSSSVILTVGPAGDCRRQWASGQGCMIEAWAVDNANNDGFPGRDREFYSIDWTAPAASASHSPLNPNDAQQVTVTATASDAASGLRNVKVYVDNTLKNTCTTPSCSYTATYAAGAHTYYATAEDNAGNTATTPTYSFTVTPSYSAQFISQTPPPATMCIGQTAAVSVTMKNTGANTWTKAAGYKLGSQNPQDNRIWDVGRVELSDTDSIATGQQKIFSWTATAPASTGSYNFQRRMLHEGYLWFGDLTPNIQVNVRSIPAAPSLTSPADNAVFLQTTRQVTLSWSPVAGATSYDVRVDDGNAAEDTSDVTGGGAPTSNNCAGYDVCINSWIPSNPSSPGMTVSVWPGRTYTWRVYAKNDCGSGASSARRFSVASLIVGSAEYPAVYSRTVKTVTVDAACLSQRQKDNKGNDVVGCPDFPKGMDIDFIVKPVIRMIGYDIACSGEAGAAYRCSITSVTIGAAAVTNVRWDAFAQGWRGVLRSTAAGYDNLNCDAISMLTANVRLENDGTTDTVQSRVYMNCTPRVVIEPLERKVVLGQKNTEAFSITIYNPAYVEGTSSKYNLRMEFLGNAEERDIARHMLGNFECRELPCPITETVSPPDSNIIKQITAKIIPPRKTILIKLSDIGAVRADVYPFKFVAEASPGIEGEATLMVYAEGLDEFAAWQLIFLVMGAMLIFIGISADNSTNTRKTLIRIDSGNDRARQ